MKLFVWINKNSDSDFIDSANADFGNHSGCFVVLAENEEEACAMANKETLSIGNTKPVEIDLSKKGIVVNADGEC